MKDSLSPGIVSPYLLIEGDGAHMDILRDGEADLILASPPYFDEKKTAPLLMEPISRQNQFETVQRCLDTFALGLRPVFCEMQRTLRAGGALIIQTKDIRYGGFLLPLAETHRRILAEIGFGLVTHVSWRKFSRRRASAATRPVGTGGRPVGRTGCPRKVRQKPGFHLV